MQMIRLILTIMLSALDFVSMGAKDCVTPFQVYDSRGELVWGDAPRYLRRGDGVSRRPHSRAVPLSGPVRGHGNRPLLQPFPILLPTDGNVHLFRPHRAGGQQSDAVRVCQGCKYMARSVGTKMQNTKRYTKGDKKRTRSIRNR